MTIKYIGKQQEIQGIGQRMMGDKTEKKNCCMGSLTVKQMIQALLNRRETVIKDILNKEKA